jgi:hypothetical protein
LREAQIVIESWRRHFNTIRPHASLGYKPPAPEVFRACIRRVAGCATSTSFAGHASTKAGLELTFHLDHPLGSHHVPVVAGLPLIASGKLGRNIAGRPFRCATHSPGL